MRKLLLPFVIILVGTGWLLTSLGFLPGVHWGLPAVLGFLGTAVLVIDTISRFTFIVGLTMIAAGIFRVLQQAQYLPQDTVLPLTLLTLGLLWILSYILIKRIPTPKERAKALQKSISRNEPNNS
ncbi:MAG: hypothetical protein GX801_07000 [Fibrobacter sp.]|nr:hypothetical protein [Fibrobacter sp.]